jgi:hypothetical protein
MKDMYKHARACRVLRDHGDDVRIRSGGTGGIEEVWLKGTIEPGSHFGCSFWICLTQHTDEPRRLSSHVGLLIVFRCGALLLHRKEGLEPCLRMSRHHIEQGCRGGVALIKGDPIPPIAAMSCSFVPTIRP